MFISAKRRKVFLKFKTSEDIYYNVSDILATVGYKVSQGEIIGRSLTSKFDNNKYLLHFEVYYKDRPIDPETIYNLKMEELDKME